MTKFDKETRHGFLLKKQNNNNNNKKNKNTLTFLLHCLITSMTATLGEIRDNNMCTLRTVRDRK